MCSPQDEKQKAKEREKLILNTINSKDISEIKDSFLENALFPIDYAIFVA
ncbi:hypothetical protein [Clostridium beijerinckii]|nr:hypothetical protein [Clostridium beijerinckii]